LDINPYEIKELLQLQKEDQQDLRDWEKYINQQNTLGNTLSQIDQPGLSLLIQQLLQLTQTQNQGMMMRNHSAPRNIRHDYPQNRNQNFQNRNQNQGARNNSHKYHGPRNNYPQPQPAP
jgi:predicted metal-dependent phosphoesterase TrpH